MGWAVTTAREKYLQWTNIPQGLNRHLATMAEINYSLYCKLSEAEKFCGYRNEL